jgi:hypothetical protein
MMIMKVLSHAHRIIIPPLLTASGSPGLQRGSTSTTCRRITQISVNNHTCNLIEDVEHQAITTVTHTIDSCKHIAQDEKHH